MKHFKKHFLLLYLFFVFIKGSAQVGTLTGTGMSICNLYSFSVCPSQTITPFNYGNQGYTCTGQTMPDVSFNINGPVWRVMKLNWFFLANVAGQVVGYTSSGALQTIPFSASNTITPLSYSGNFVQFAVNGVATGTLVDQSTFSITINSALHSGNSYTYCPSNSPSIQISPVIPSQGGPWNYSWQPGSLTGSVVTVSPSSSMIYTVTISSPSACTSTVQVDVSVNCPLSTALFSAPDTVCVNQQFNVTDQSNGATTYYWNFCQGNTSTTPQGINLGNIGNMFNGPVFITVAKDASGYYAFVTNNSSSTITRLFFGNSLLNNPVATNLGNVGGVLPGNLEDIHLELENGTWYGIVTGGMLGGERLVRLNFGTSLANMPTATNFGNIGTMNYPQRIKVFKSGNNYYGIIANRDNNTITRINFGNSLANTPTGTNLGNIGSLNTPDALGIVFVNNSWYGYVINEGNNTITRLDFGNNLVNTPTGVNLGNTGALNGPRAIDMWTECGQIKGLITNRFGNDMLDMNFPAGPTGPLNTASFGNIASFSFPHSISRFRSGDTLYAFITNVNNNSLSRVYFTSCTNSSIASSTLASPPSISYNAPGTYYLSQVINEGQLSQASYCKPITVIASPTLSALSTSICTGQTATLSAVGATTYSWSNGASGSSISVAPTSTTIYTVVGAIGTCTSQTTSTVNVSPSSTVSVSGNTLICAGQSSTLTAAGASGYSWSTGATTASIIVSPTLTSTYSATATGSLCVIPSAITVSVVSVPIVSAGSNTVICLGQGGVTLTASGANTYTWTGSGSLSSTTGSVVTATPSVSTTYTVAGMNTLCTNSAVVTVSVNQSPTITAVSYTNTSCGLNNGGIVISSLPSTNSYSWSSGVSTSTNVASGLAAGIYTVHVINGSCQTSTAVTVSGSQPLTIISSSVSGSNCGANNGSLSVMDNYTNSVFSWTPNISNSGTVGNLSAGNYSLTVYNGPCSTSSVFTVPQLSGPTDLNFSQSDAVCENANGSIIVNGVTNGVTPYEFAFDNTGYSSVSTFSNLAQGIYTITVRDFYGCVYSTTVSVNTITVSSSVSLTTISPSCDNNDGSIQVNVISGGIAPFLISFNGSSFSPNTQFEGLAPGNYTLIVRDSNLCETKLVIEVPIDKNDYTLYVPNTFTPNKDLVNDTWFVKGTCINSFNCLIFNRWGQKIIELNDITEYWDGTYEGENVPDGVYVYLIEAETNNGTIYKNGHITLFR